MNRVESQFVAFHADHPEVYALFKRFTFEAIRAGWQRIGAKMIWERMRWFAAVEAGDGEYRLNNNFTAYYARLFMQDHPEHVGLFECRSTRGEQSRKVCHGNDT